MVIPRNYPIKWLLEIYPDEEVVYNNRTGENDSKVNYEALYEPRDHRQKEDASLAR